jgi:hypothetical protein
MERPARAWPAVTGFGLEVGGGRRSALETQMDTEAGADGFDENYFVQQVAGLSQLAGEFMRVKPLVIDLGWGTLKLG